MSVRPGGAVHAGGAQFRLSTLLLAVAAMSCLWALGVQAWRTRDIFIWASLPVIGFGVTFLLFAADSQRRMAAKEVLDGLCLATGQGMPLEEALERMARDAPPCILPVIEGIRSKLADTGSLAAALDHFPRRFSPALRSAIRVVERYAVTDRALPHLLDVGAWGETSARPFLPIIYVALLAPVILLWHVYVGDFLARTVADLANGFGLPLTPDPTALGISYFAGKGMLALIILFTLWYSGLECARTAMIVLAARLPVISRVVFSQAAGSYAHLLGLLLSAGLPVHIAHQSAAEGVAPPHLRRRFEAITALLSDGMPLALALERLRGPSATRGRLVRAAMSSAMPAAFLQAAQGIARDLNELQWRVARALYPTTVVVLGTAIGSMSYVWFSWISALAGVH